MSINPSIEILFADRPTRPTRLKRRRRWLQRCRKWWRRRSYPPTTVSRYRWNPTDCWRLAIRQWRRRWPFRWPKPTISHPPSPPPLPPSWRRRLLRSPQPPPELIRKTVTWTQNSWRWPPSRCDRPPLRWRTRRRLIWRRSTLNAIRPNGA